jgi:hypothetical protein
MIAIMDYLQDTLFENAFKRKQILINVSNLYDQIAINLIKIAVFGQESTWKDEFETCIDKIARMVLKNKKNKLPAIKYYNALFEEPFEPIDPWDSSYVYKTIMSKHILKNLKYSELKHIQINKQNITLIYEKIKDLIKGVSILLANPLIDYDKFYEITNKYVKFWETYKEN